MTNKTRSSPQEFEPSETIRETTVGLCWLEGEIFTFQLMFKGSRTE